MFKTLRKLKKKTIKIKKKLKSSVNIIGFFFISRKQEYYP